MTAGQYRGVAVDLRGVTTVLLAGTGSDDDYVHRAFSGPLREVGAMRRVLTESRETGRTRAEDQTRLEEVSTLELIDAGLFLHFLRTYLS